MLRLLGVQISAEMLLEWLSVQLGLESGSGFRRTDRVWWIVPSPGNNSGKESSYCFGAMGWWEHHNRPLHGLHRCDVTTLAEKLEANAVAASWENVISCFWEPKLQKQKVDILFLPQAKPYDPQPPFLTSFSHIFTMTFWVLLPQSKAICWG